jgi:1-acyl-sn-glycerol-3-phosphate acyltransferase
MQIRQALNRFGQSFLARVDAEAALQQPWYEMGRDVVGAYGRLLFGLDVHYRSALPAGAKILAANHPSTSDPMLMTTLVPEPVSILINETLFHVPVVGMSLRLCGHIRVDHDNGRMALEQGVRYLQAGRTVGVFPEGEISLGESHCPRPRTGVARLALRARAPIIPVGIAVDMQRIRYIRTRVEGREEVGTWYAHGPYAMTVGEPMRFAGDVEDREYVHTVAEKVMKEIVALRQESGRRVLAARSWRLVSFQRVWSFCRQALFA